MGDRALIQLKEGDKYSPVLYTHWSGYRVGPILEDTRKRMESRGVDLAYAFARLVQITIGNDQDNTGYGVWNHDGPLTDSHGDAGAFIVDITDPKQWKVQQFGGYGLGGYDDEPEKFTGLVVIE